MGIVLSLFVAAIGAILRWGVSNTADGLNLDTIGLILLIVGLIGIVISAIYEYSDRTRVSRREVIRKEI